MLSELQKKRLVKEIDPDAGGYFKRQLEIALEKGAQEAVAGYIEAQVHVLIAKLRQLEQYRDHCQDRLNINLSDPNTVLRHAHAVACGRIDQIKIDIQTIQGIGAKMEFDGWRFMPPEPTREMLRQACAASLDTGVLVDDTEFACERACYKSFLATAPAIPIGSVDPSQTPSSSS